MTRERYNKETGTFYEVGGPDDPNVREGGPGYFVLSDLPDHVSPIDRTVLTGRAARREHMKKHGVADQRDFKFRADIVEKAEIARENALREGKIRR